MSFSRAIIYAHKEPTGVVIIDADKFADFIENVEGYTSTDLSGIVTELLDD